MHKKELERLKDALVNFPKWYRQFKGSGASPESLVDLYIKQYAELQKDRSLQQNAFYWGTLIPTIIYHAPDGVNIPDADSCHFWLKLNYCITKRPELLQFIKTRDRDGVIHEVCIPPSAAFDKMPAKAFTMYVEWCKEYISLIVGSSIDALIDAYNMKV